ncbi:MAG: hypothetical protein ACR2HG_10730 [Pyrinomonadaceae bacterium]
MSEKRFFSQLPNLIDDSDLTPYGHRLYVHLLRVCGADGVCTQGVRLLSAWCKMSMTRISKARDELEIKGLVKVQPISTPNGKGFELKVIDIWNLNVQIYDKDSKMNVPKNPNATQRTALEAARRFENFKSQNRNTMLPPDFKLMKKLRDWAEKNCSGVDVELEFELFVNANLAAGNKSRNWESYFKKWLKNAVIYKS